MDILDYWSLQGKTPRESQIKILEVIDEAFESYNNVILDAGVGIGKSAIATTLMNSFQEGYIITMTNQLLEQYRHDFPTSLYHVKGRSNYPCLRGGNCKDCFCGNEEVSRCKECSYLKAVKAISVNPYVITNYDYLYYAGNFAGHFQKRNLLVFDEAHNFEKKIMDLVSETLTRRFVYKEYHFDIFEPIMKREPLKSLDKDYWRGIIEKCIDKESERYCKNKIEEKKKEYRLIRYDRMLSVLHDYLIDLPMKKDIMNKEKLSKSLKITLKPLKLTSEPKDLFRFGKKKLFMTGTLGDKDKFCEWNGIDSDDTFYHYEKSPFPVEHRPIYNLQSCSMKQGAWKNNSLIRVLQRIINEHSGEKGVIHTSSNEQAWWIKKNLASNKVWVVQGKTREDTIQKFEESTADLVLVGAGIKDGVNFNDDKCRYQILFKIPFPSIGDEQIRQRKKMDESWYIYNTVMPLMQSYGRGVRNENDTCDYYILDRDFNDILKDYKYFFNEYFLEAIRRG